MSAFRVTPDEPAPWMGATSWLLMPLCGPENPLAPMAVAVVVCAAGAALSTALRRPWPWVLGGPAASVAYGLTVQIVPVASTR